MRRGIKILLGLVGLAGLAALAHGPVVRWAGRRAVEKASARLGLDIAVERYAPVGLLGLRLEGVRVGFADDPLVTIDAVSAEVAWRDAVHGRLMPKRVEVERPVVSFAGDGSVEGGLRVLADRARSARRPGGGGDSGDGGASGVPLPVVRVTGGRLVDRRGAMELDGVDLEVKEGGAIAGAFRAVTPRLESCRFEALLEGRRPVRADVRCDHPHRVAWPGLGYVEAGGAGMITGEQGRWLELRGARLGRGEDDELPTPLDGALLDARVFLEERPERPVEVTLTLPGGARLSAAGTLSRERLVVRADFDDLRVADVHATLGGTASGHFEARWDFAARHGEVDGDLTLAGLMVTHPRLADEPVGPAELGLAGKLLVDLEPERRARLLAGRVRAGNVTAELEADVTLADGGPRVQGRLALGPVNGEDLTAAVPPGLMPNLSGIRLTGPLSLGVDVAIDARKLDDARLDIDLDVAKLRVTQLPPGLRMKQLRDTFETRFEMPDGTIIKRVTGPNSDRWTPIDEVPPLLPIALMASEDNGFFRHRGVSMLHLRQSLITNLQQGRFVRGASTLTMQLARNLFLHRRKVLTRKLEEFVVTWLLEREFEKRDLLALYLNVVEFGPEIFGIGDAARHYFDKAPADLTPVEIAFLVRLLPGPRRYYAQFKKRRVEGYYQGWMQSLLDLLLEHGQLTPEEHAAAKPAALWQTPPTSEETPR